MLPPKICKTKLMSKFPITQPLLRDKKIRLTPPVRFICLRYALYRAFKMRNCAKLKHCFTIFCFIANHHTYVIRSFTHIMIYKRLLRMFQKETFSHQTCDCVLSEYAMTHTTLCTSSRLYEKNRLEHILNVVYTAQWCLKAHSWRNCANQLPKIAILRLSCKFSQIASWSTRFTCLASHIIRFMWKRSVRQCRFVSLAYDTLQWSKVAKVRRQLTAAYHIFSNEHCIANSQSHTIFFATPSTTHSLIHYS